MKFNLVYGNHSNYGIHIADTLRLIKYGLQSIGHIVAISPMMKAGENNILVECFTYDFIVAMENLRKQPNTRFIILATEYISDNERFNYFPDSSIEDKGHYTLDSLWQKRWKTFCLATKSCDAIWHLSENQVKRYQAYFKNIPVGYLPHGYLDELIRVRPVEQQLKDIDVLFTGTMTPYREAMIGGLTSSGLNVIHGAANTPEHLREDWVGRSKLAINLRQNSNWSYPSNSRFFYHIVNSSLLLTEQCAESCDLDDYVLHVESSEFVERVRCLLEQDTSKIAEKKLESFKIERPLAPLITELMAETFDLEK